MVQVTIGRQAKQVKDAPMHRGRMSAPLLDAFHHPRVRRLKARSIISLVGWAVTCLGLPGLIPANIPASYCNLKRAANASSPHSRFINERISPVTRSRESRYTSVDAASWVGLTENEAGDVIKVEVAPT